MKIFFWNSSNQSNKAEKEIAEIYNPDLTCYVEAANNSYTPTNSSVITYHYRNTKFIKLLFSSSINKNLKTNAYVNNNIIHCSFSNVLDVFFVHIPDINKIEEKNLAYSTLLERLKHNNDNNIKTILMGDFNTLRGDNMLDTDNPRETFSEKENFRKISDENDLVDIFRAKYPNSRTCSYKAKGRGKYGYRIDHMFLSSSMKHSIKNCGYICDVKNKILFSADNPKDGISDHAGMLLEV